ncbi:MAG: hypothetical protein WCI05_06405 [Myxococcales bacterium]
MSCLGVDAQGTASVSMRSVLALTPEAGSTGLIEECVAGKTRKRDYGGGLGSP